jgi:hypothetical protein
MSKHPLFLVYGLSLIGFAGFAHYSGMTLFRPNEVRGVPKSIRDNPGIYRSIYTGYSRYSGGK